MPRVVISDRGVIPADTRFETPNRGSWIRVATDDTVCRFALDRAVDHDLTSDTVTTPFVAWQEGDPFREVCRWGFEVSYDNGTTWESLGRGATGPEIVRKPVADPDATRPVLLKTEMWMRLRAQAGRQARLIRYTVDVPESLETEVEVETYDDGRGPKVDLATGNSVGVEATNSNSAAGASSVSSGNVTASGSNTASFAYGAVGGSTSLTVDTFDIDATSATLVTGSNVDQGGSGAESWWYYLVSPTGAHDADFTASSTANDIFCGIYTLSGVDQTTPYENVGTDSNNYYPTDFLGQTVSSATDDRVLDLCVVNNYTSPAGWTGTPDTANFPIDDLSGETILRAGHEAGAATVTIGYDYDTFAASAVYSWFNVIQASSSVDDLLADDVESDSEVDTPSLGQVHGLTADDVESASAVDSPALSQVHALGADDVESASEVDTPTLSVTNVLDANDVESATEVDSPSLAQVHALTAAEPESASEVDSPAITQLHAITADDVESASQVDTPTLSESHALTANDVESASEVSSPSPGQVHALTADDAESASEVTTPAVAQAQALLADDVESASEVSAPAVSENTADHDLLADDVESSAEVSVPALGQVHAVVANAVESVSAVGSPAVTQLHALVANDVESASETSAPECNVGAAPGGGSSVRRMGGSIAGVSISGG